MQGHTQSGYMAHWNWHEIDTDQCHASTICLLPFCFWVVTIDRQYTNIYNSGYAHFRIVFFSLANVFMTLGWGWKATREAVNRESKADGSASVIIVESNNLSSTSHLAFIPNPDINNPYTHILKSQLTQLNLKCNNNLRLIKPDFLDHFIEKARQVGFRFYKCKYHI